MLTLLSLLQTRRDWGGDALAVRLAVSRRTVRRDIDELRGLGYRILAVKGPAGGYRLDAGEAIPPLQFDDDQVIALAVGLRAAALSATGVEVAALQALAGVRRLLPERLRPRLDSMEFIAAATEPALVDTAVLLAVSAAVHACEELRFDYTRPAEPERTAAGPPLRTQPHALVATAGRWYLIGWDADRDDWRVFRIDRMRLRTHRGRRFEPRDIPGGPADFLRRRFRGATEGGDWPCRGTVRLDAPASAVLPFVPPDAVVTPADDETCLLTAGSWSWGELAAAALRFEVPVTAVEPPALAEAFRAQAERAARAAPPPD